MRTLHFDSILNDPVPQDSSIIIIIPIYIYLTQPKVNIKPKTTRCSFNIIESIIYLYIRSIRAHATLYLNMIK